MSNTYNILDEFVKEYEEKYTKKKAVYEDSLIGDIKKVKDLLLNERFYPSVQLEEILNKQLRKAVYPIEIAIAGQFSSGKSTFLNALLSKDILPTGITPVTSKVNFINYAKNYKLKITYNSGAQEYHSIESISKFTDQREDLINDIKYLSIYAPIEMLKDISFVDTPGLNSQSVSDTQITKKVLKDVGGIIWLTLIDNAGKKSEKDVLESYLKQFKLKSLCVLNQKDKFDEEDIQKSKSYIENKFSKYFSKVTPISAQQALNARENENNTLKEINKNESLFMQSNIQEVLDFINTVIKPNAAISKEYTIKKSLKNICEVLIKQYGIILGVFDSLTLLLKQNEPINIDLLGQINNNYTSNLLALKNNIESNILYIAQIIYKNIDNCELTRYEKEDTMLFGQSIKEHQYKSYLINKDNILNELFYDDNSINKKLKRVMKEFKIIQENINNDFYEVYLNLQNNINSWKNHYLLLRKSKEIASETEFSNIRRFASQVHENITQEFHLSILKSIEELNKQTSSFDGAFTSNTLQIVQSTMAHFQDKIIQSQEIHKNEPSKFFITKPSIDEIFLVLKENFSFTNIDKFLCSNRNYLNKVALDSKKYYTSINNQKLDFIDKEKDAFILKVNNLRNIQKDI